MKKPLHIEEISPELFTWDSYENDYGGRLDLDFRESTEMRTMEREIRKRAVGYCQGSRLSIRPKSDMYGLMLEDDDGERFWFHYPRVCLDSIMDGIDWEAVDRLNESEEKRSRNGSRKKPDKEPNGKKEPRINGLTVPEYVRTIERAHEATKHSKLVFK